MRTWMITGCSSGFGRMLAQAALETDDRVIATARNPETVADLTRAFPEQCDAIALDVGSHEAVLAGAHAALDSRLGREGIDVLVHNAGYGLIGAIEECDQAQIDRNFAVNFFGPLQLTKAMLPHMRQRAATGTPGMIIAMSAAAAIANYAGFGIYGAAKWALEGMCESLRAELAPIGIKVMMVQPGPFRTDFIARSLDKGSRTIDAYARTSGQFAGLLSRMSGKQPGDPQRAAHAILQASRSATPPARLVIGRYAIEKVKKRNAASAAELTSWEELGASADFPR